MPKKKYVPNGFYEQQCANLSTIWHNKKYKDFGIERLIRLTIQLLSFATPAGLIRWVTGKSKNLLVRKISIEVYAIGKVVFAWQAISHGWTSNGWVTVFIVIMTADTLHFLLGRIILNDIWRQPISFQRSLIMTFVNYAEICLCFAAIYYYWDHAYSINGYHVFSVNDKLAKFQDHLPPVTYIYFSFVTAATIGYGDISPFDPFVQSVVNAQIIISLFMVVVIIASLASKLQDDTFYNKEEKKKEKEEAEKAKAKAQG
ncbi:ion channel [Mucilaginibacter ximonensis]|uniref:Ion channel n=1 Tax=Mucilaginibacter ximonensis TaxID=538021 RepID=A0ABW5Y9F7_9SPHI